MVYAGKPHVRANIIVISCRYVSETIAIITFIDTLVHLFLVKKPTSLIIDFICKTKFATNNNPNTIVMISVIIVIIIV